MKLENKLKSEGWTKIDNLFKIRIHDLMWCEIDEYGFATIIRKLDWASDTKSIHKVTLPRPVRDENTLNALMVLLNAS